MGLDGVELIMSCEEAFGVELKIDETENIATPRMLIDVIFSKLQSTDRKICQSQRAFYLLRKAFMQIFKLPRATITPDMPFRHLIPREKEREIWAELKRAVHARNWPELVRPPWLVWTLVFLILGVFPTLFLLQQLPKPYDLPGIGLWEATLISAFTVLGLSLFMGWATRKTKTRIPAGIELIRDMVPYAVTSDQVEWTREQVACLVKQLVIEQLGINEKKYREDADFIKELGIN